MNKKFIIFAFMLICTLGAAYFFSGSNIDNNIGKVILGGKTETHQVVGDIGGEKKGFFNNEKVKRIFERNGVELNVRKEGSITMVTSPTNGKDFLSPSTNIAVDLFSSNGGQFTKHETVFYSPIVVYSWKGLIPQLTKIGLVKKEVDHYSLDLNKLQDFILEDKKFSDLGIQGDDRYLKVFSTDPTKSNSGNMFAGLNYNILKKKFPDISDKELLEKLGNFFDKMGFMPGSSGDIFKNFLNKGESIMMTVGYENQLIEFYNSHPEYKDYIKNDVVILYPSPTVWSEHEIIALNKNGEKIITVFKENKELEKIASEEHGFRIIGGKIQGTLELENIPEKIKNIEPLPSYKVVDSILNFLKKRNEI